jgi:hypothetical protein
MFVVCTFKKLQDQLSHKKQKNRYKTTNKRGQEIDTENNEDERFEIWSKCEGKDEGNGSNAGEKYDSCSQVFTVYDRRQYVWLQAKRNAINSLLRLRL